MTRASRQQPPCRSPGKVRPHTRIVEIKHATSQQIGTTTIVREFPKNWTPDGKPYYPVPALNAHTAFQ